VSSHRALWQLVWDARRFSLTSTCSASECFFQTGALFKKNLLLARYNRTSTALRLIACFFFVFAIWLVDTTLQVTSARSLLVGLPLYSILTLISLRCCSVPQANLENFTAFRNLASPDQVSVPGIPDCTAVRTGTGCKIFAYAPAHSERFVPTSDTPGAGWSAEVSRVHSVVRGIISNNKPAIDAGKVMGFTSLYAMET